MKYLLITFSAISSITFFAKAQNSGTTFADAQKTKKANIVYKYIPIQPYVFDKAGSVVGFNVGLMKSFEKYMKSKYGIQITSSFVRTENAKYRQMLNEVTSSTGGVLSIIPFVITPQRKAEYDLSDSYMKNVEIIITNSTVPNLSSLDALAKEFAGKKAYTVRGSVNEKLIKSVKEKYYPNLEIVPLGSYNEVPKRVALDKDSFAFLNVAAYVGSDKYSNQLKIHMSASRTEEEFGIVFRKGSDWVKPFNEFLKSGFVGSAEYNDLIRKFMGEKTVKLINYYNR